ncbi:hypothetical protein Q8F55_003116 [Vanrija albida]|uniref:SnoaL-like domain-containing protein n=1 Tax=Vanrija albida TaxID=181172 RepID=A0ABR3QBN9_9TREE
MSATKFTPDQNRAVIARYFAEYWGKGNVDIVDELCAPDYLIHYPMHGPVRGREASKKMLRDFRASFPDLTFWGVGPLIAENTREGDFVVGRWDGGGTHTGAPFADLALGSLDTAGTGKKMRFTGTTVFRLEGGKIVEEMGEEGALRALYQLGLVGDLRWT